MIHHGQVDGHTEAYLGVRARLDEVLRHRAGDEAVPSCPGWTVRHVVAHLAGLCEDWVAGRLEGYGSEAWTATQVERFADAPLTEILTQWDRALAGFVVLPADPAMGPPGRWAFGDAVVHEADLRAALGERRVPLDAVALALKGQIARWREVVGGAGLPALLLRCPDLRDWWLGEHDDPGAVVAEAPAYEVFRALAGRRSEAQIRSWTWSADPSPHLAAGLPYPFSFAAEAVVEEGG